MPAIRDYSFAYETVTTDAGLTVPMCAYESGDLLLAFCVGDSGTPTWGCSNGVGTWNQLFAQNNSASTVCYWKYASSGEGDVVFTSTVNETYSGAVVAVRDCYQGYTGGSPPTKSNSTQAASTRFTVSSITTTTDDSLIIIGAGTTASAGSIHGVEGILQNLLQVDGSAESLGLAWFIQKSAGATPTPYLCASASGAGVKWTIEVRAPSSGATVMPPYPVSDASIYLSPNPSAAFDGNTAMAATADTNFGTSIAGKTCNDATVAAALDIGIDVGAFMSMSGLTNAATADQMSGAEAVMAASRYNVGNRNILMHFRHPAPAHNQRLTPLSSGRGVWVGMKSGATAGANWKVWQVHGGDVKMPPGYVRPIIISAANTDTIATNGTLDNADIRRYGFWTGGVGVLTQQSCFGPMWAMDTTVLAGGVAGEPVDIPAIIQSAALNKVRFSSQLQGANQMLCMQAIQFGDGGTNPIYLKINGGAVEFPSLKDVTKKLVNYNGTANSVGWTFYPGASDTINLAGTAFSSSSQFHWRIHASASASATWNLSGVVINGAGDVTLRPVTTFSGMTFANCPAITQNGAVIDGCTFTDSKVTSATLSDMDNISNCTFVSSGTGHAIEVSGSAGTIAFSGNTFTGYAASNGSTGNEAIYVNIATGTVTINITDGGSTPSIRTAGATVVVQNAVTVSVTVKDASTLLPIENARVLVKKVSDGTDILTGLTNASGVVTTSYAYSGDTAITGTARRASSGYGTLYKPGSIAGTITSAGLDVTVLLISDE